MGHWTEGDKVMSTRNTVCEGQLIRQKMFGPKVWTHEDSRDAIMLVYQSGDIEIICPICGRY